jgi:hypothetical protein
MTVGNAVDCDFPVSLNFITNIIFSTELDLK